MLKPVALATRLRCSPIGRPSISQRAATSFHARAAEAHRALNAPTSVKVRSDVNTRSLIAAHRALDEAIDDASVGR